MQTNQTVVLASSNQGKLKELSKLVGRQHIQLRPQSDFHVCDADETGLSFIENAILKARHASNITGLPALADDSGLSVDALDGAPGIYSARFAGKGASDSDNIDKLLEKLKDLPKNQRQAQFHCTLAYLRHAKDPNPQLFIGIWHGEILSEPTGDNGFGYDPIFYCPQSNCSAAQLSPQQKQAISHRGKALDLMTKNWRP